MPAWKTKADSIENSERLFATTNELMREGDEFKHGVRNRRK